MLTKEKREQKRKSKGLVKKQNRKPSNGIEEVAQIYERSNGFDELKQKSNQVRPQSGLTSAISSRQSTRYKNMVIPNTSFPDLEQSKAIEENGIQDYSIDLEKT